MKALPAQVSTDHHIVNIFEIIFVSIPSMQYSLIILTASLRTNFTHFSRIPLLASAVKAIDEISTVSITQAWIALAFIDF